MSIRPHARIAAAYLLLLLPCAPLAAAPAVRLSALEAEPLAAAAAGLEVGATLEVEAAELADDEPPVKLELTRFEVFAADTEIHVHGEDGEQVLRPPANVYLRGGIAGDPGSLVVLAVHEDGSSRGIATWTAADGARTSILEGTSGRLHGGLVDKAGFAAEAANFRCEVEEAGEADAATVSLPEPPAPSAVEPAPEPLAASTHTARVAIETDYELYLKFNSVAAATNYIFDLFAYITTIYEAQISVNLVVGYISLYTTSNDPWIETSTHCGSREFGRYWNLNRTGVPRTIAHFMSGRATGGGLAWLGALCYPAFTTTATGCIGVPASGNYGGDYGFTGNLLGNFVPGSPGVVWDSMSISHEIGHNFNSPHTHCYAGVGGNSQPVDKCWNAESGTGCWTGAAALPGPQGQASGTIMSYCHQLAGGYTNIAMNFGVGHGFGVAPSRVATRMRDFVLTTSAANAACLPMRQQLRTIKAGAGGGTVTSSPAGINCGATCFANFANAASVTLTAAPVAGSVFAGWSGEGCSGTGTCAVSMTQLRNVTATFNLQTFALSLNKTGTGTGTVTSSPAGIDCGATCSATYSQGTNVTLTAAPTAGSTFTGWSGEGCTGTGACVVAMTQARNVSAAFALNTYALTVAKSGSGSGAVTSSPAGIDCGATCAANFGHGTSVTLTAAPTAGSTFTGWTGEGCTGTGACVVAMTQARNVSAAFALNTYALTVAKSGSGSGAVTSSPAGIDCGATCTAIFAHGASVTLSAAPTAGSTFNGWTGEGCTGTGTCVISMTQARSVSAAFTLNSYALTVAKTGTGAGTVTSAPAGIDCGATCTATFSNATSVTLSAAPTAGSIFTGWSGEGCTGTGSCVISMTQARNVSAAFTLNTYALTVAKTGTGAGTVTSVPAGIDCGATCSATYNHATSVTLTASPNAGSTFSGWTGESCSGTGSCVVSMTQARNVSAAFTLNTYALTVAKTGTGAGSVTSSPAGIDCGATCSGTFNHATSVTLTAAPTTGSTFTGWTGEGCTGTGTCVVSMTQARNVSAAFTLNTYALTVAKIGTGAGTVTSAPAGINCGATCAANFGHSTSVTLTAAPTTGSTFTGWTGEGCTGTGTCVVAMTQARNVSAAFTLNTYALTVAKTGTGAGTVTSVPAGIDCGATCSATFSHATSVTLTASPNAGSTFSGWTGESCSGTGSCVVSMTQARNVSAAFTLNTYALTVAKTGTGAGTVTSSPAGIDCGATCSGTFNHATSVTLTAAPTAGSIFTGWSGEGCTGTGSCVISMTQARNVSAAFILNTYALTVAKTGTGAGSVTSSPAGIDCGATCSATFSHATSVTLMVSPNAGSTFSGWTGESCSGTGSCVVSMTQARNVSAAFTLNAYALTVSKTGTGAGTVTSSPAGIDCGATCSATYNHATSVTLAASPTPGSTFSGWTGEGCSGTGSCVVSMTQARNVSAAFTQNTYALAVAKTGTGTGTVTGTPAGIDCGATCSASYGHGIGVTLTATAAAGSTFTGWSGEGCTGTATCVVAMTQARSVTAAFTLDTYALTVAKTGAGSGAVTSSPAGIDCGSSCTATFGHGTGVVLTATPSVDSTFDGWSGEGCSGTGTCTVSMTQARNVAASFSRTSYTLAVAKTGTGAGRVASSPAGIDCGSSCSASYSHGTRVVLTATPSAGSTFAGWSGEGCSGTGPCTVAMTQARSVAAAFTLGTFPLSLTQEGNGPGRVVSSPAGLDCSASCAAHFGFGTSVLLKATPGEGTRFAGWSGEGCSGTGVCVVSMTAARHVTARFELLSYLLEASVVGGGSGAVTSSPAGIACGSACQATFLHGTAVTLTAQPAPGSILVGWSGETCPGAGPCTVLMTQARSVAAIIQVGVFRDGFEGGNTGAWSLTVP